MYSANQLPTGASLYTYICAIELTFVAMVNTALTCTYVTDATLYYSKNYSVNIYVQYAI